MCFLQSVSGKRWDPIFFSDLVPTQYFSSAKIGIARTTTRVKKEGPESRTDFKQNCINAWTQSGGPYCVPYLFLQIDRAIYFDWQLPSWWIGGWQFAAFDFNAIRTVWTMFEDLIGCAVSISVHDCHHTFCYSFKSHSHRMHSLSEHDSRNHPKSSWGNGIDFSIQSVDRDQRRLR